MRHETDRLSLVAGLAFLGLAAIFLLAENGLLDVSPRFLWPTLLIGLGVAGLVGSRGRARRDSGEAAVQQYDRKERGHG